MSRNEDRAGAPPTEESPAPVVATAPAEDTTFNWSVPTEFEAIIDFIMFTELDDILLKFKEPADRKNAKKCEKNLKS